MTPDKITLAEFREKLGKYPALIATRSKPSSDGKPTLVELDQYRYVDAPSEFSKKAGGKAMELTDILKLLEWKLRHGTFRPTLKSLVSSNSEEKVTTVTSEAFAQYAKEPTNIKATIEKLTELKGIGPATASLFLAVHDPENVIFFEDEAYQWLCQGGEKTKIAYNLKEFEEIFKNSKALSTKLKVSPIDIEKVSYVIIKENEPPKEVKPAKVSSGLPRGRPKKPDHLKKPVKPKSGLGRGRPVGSKKKTESKTESEKVKEEDTKETPNGKRKAEDDTPRSGKKVKA